MELFASSRKYTHTRGVGTIAVAALAAALAGVSLGSCKNPLAEEVRKVRVETASPRLSVSRDAIAMQSGEAVDFGNVSVQGSLEIELRIANYGANDLTIGQNSIAIALSSGTEAGSFSILQAPASTIAAGASSTLRLRFSPVSLGQKQAVVAIATNDVLTPNFVINLRGIGSSGANDITRFDLSNGTLTVPGTISGTNISLSWPTPNANEITGLTAIFSTSGVGVRVNGASQTSGSSRNDFSSPVVYVVEAANGNTQSYTVTVNVVDVAPLFDSTRFPSVPIVSITATTANVSDALILSNGGSTITECGYCWGITYPPTIDGSHAAVGAQQSGTYQYPITGLNSGTLYYVRPYATNALGTSYGQTTSFWTLLDQPTGLTAEHIDGPAGSGLLRVTWNPVIRTSTYDLYCATGSSMPSTPAVADAQSPCTLSGLTNFQNYTIWLLARNGSNVPSQAQCLGSPGVHVTSVSLGADIYMGVGTSRQISAVVNADATDPLLSWSVGSSSVASLDSSAPGTVRAGATPDNTTLTVRSLSDPTVFDTRTLYTGVPVSSLSLDKNSDALSIGIFHSLTATVAPSNATLKVLSWSSTDPSIASVSSSGTVLGVGQGLATITVSLTDRYSGTTYRADCLVTVDAVAMANLPGGTFQRSNTSTELTAVSTFSMSVYPVTQALYSWVTGQNPSANTAIAAYPALSRPVDSVSWYDAVVFCNLLSMQQHLTPVYSLYRYPGPESTDPAAWGTAPVSPSGEWNSIKTDVNANGYRLPTEMEWIWASMGGLSDSRIGDKSGSVNIGGYSKFFAGSTSQPLRSEVAGAMAPYAWSQENSSGTTQAVGLKLPNELGLYDMSGNVREWCEDRASSSATGYDYSSSGTSLSGPLYDFCRVQSYWTTTARAVHGGSCLLSASSSSADLDAFALAQGYRAIDSDSKAADLGFRVVRKVDSTSYVPNQGDLWCYFPFNGGDNTTFSRDLTLFALRTSTFAPVVLPSQGHTGVSNTAITAWNCSPVIAFNSNPAFASDVSFALSLWFRTSSVSGTIPCKIVEGPTSGENLYVCLSIDGDSLVAEAGSPSDSARRNRVVAQHALAASTWYHVAMSFDKESHALTLYLNNNLVGSSATIGTTMYGSWNDNLIVGGDVRTWGGTLDLDELLIYTGTTLSASDVQILYSK